MGANLLYLKKIKKIRLQCLRLGGENVCICAWLSGMCLRNDARDTRLECFTDTCVMQDFKLSEKSQEGSLHFFTLVLLNEQPCFTNAQHTYACHCTLTGFHHWRASTFCFCIFYPPFKMCYERSLGVADCWTCFCFDFLSSGKCLEWVPAPPSLNMTTSESSIPPCVMITPCLSTGSTTNPPKHTGI